eukprot:c15426_g1_i2 orf=455-3070(-)
MSGSGKRAHDDFGSNLSNSSALPSLKQHDEEHSLLMANGDMASADMAPHVDNVAEPRPPKLPRLDYGNRFQKRSGVEDPMVVNSSFGLDSKGDGRDTKMKVSTEEKGGHGDTKTNNYEEKGESDAWKDTRLDSSHDGRVVTMERFNRNGGGVGSSSGWRREQRLEHKEDSREQWKENADGKWDSKRDTHEEKIERDAGKDCRSDSMNQANERANRSNTWRRDQRFEAKDDARELWKDHKDRGSARVGTDHRDAAFWGNKRIGRKNSMEEDGELKESEEAGLEMQVDFKREEKDKEQERKTRDDSLKDKEDKEREEKPARWGGHASNAVETVRERWEKGKELKEKGRDKRDHTHGEREELGMVKQEMEDFDLPKKAGYEGNSIAENSELERKPSKDSETIKAVESDDRERRKDRDREKKIEHERLGDRKPREQEKAPADDASPEDGDRDKETFVNHNFQQKRRMLRSRGPSQALNRDGRPRILSKDPDGNQGSSDTTAITYRPGEYMPELTKLWKEYESLKNGEGTSSGQGPTIEIRIPAKLVTTSNHQVRGSQLWGTDVYTDDSDLVAVLMHTGYYRPTASQPPFSVQELRATVRVLPPQDSYTSTLRNNIRSRAWGAASGCSYSVHQCRILKVSGGHIDLEPCLTRISAVAPTLAPAAMERTMMTRAASSNAYRQQRFVQEVTIQYNLCNEPWMKYSMSIVADRGLKKSQYTSARLRKGEVLYLETHRKRYELSYNGEKVACNGGFGATTATSAPVTAAGDKNKDKENEKTLCNHNGERLPGRGTGGNDKGHLQNGDMFDHYKWALCRQPLPLKVMLAKGVPLPSEFVEVLEDGLAWEEIQWSQAGVWVRGKEYPLARAQFLSQNLDNLE